MSGRMMPLILKNKPMMLSYTYRDNLMTVFSNHNPSDPLFLYLPIDNVHTPLQAPQEWMDIYPTNSTCMKRDTYQAMVRVAVNVTGHVVNLLKEKNVWDIQHSL